MTSPTHRQHRIHYHSDCSFFAGCENMLVNFWSSLFIRQKFEQSFSYRASQRYIQGLNARSKIDFPSYSLCFPEFSNPSFLPKKIPFFVQRVIMFILRLVGSMPLLIYQVWILQRLFRQIKPDLIHINNGGYPAALSARAAVIAGKVAGIKNIVMVVNNLAIDYRRFSRWWEYPIDRFVARTTTVFVTGSRTAGVQLKKVLRLPDNKLQAIHNGITVRNPTETVDETRKRLGLSEFDGVLLGIISVMDERKGHRVLLDALHQMVNTRVVDNQPFKLLIEGDGVLRQSLEKYVLENQLGEYCLFIGTEPNVMNLMALLDILILPSISHEDFPNIVIEAMAFSKPVIASRIAGTVEQILQNETGLLVEPHDITGLSRAIQILLSDEPRRKQMGALGQKRFQDNFEADVAVKKYVSLYQSMIME